MRTLLLPLLLLSAAGLSAQERYTPGTDLPTKPQILAIYFGATSCVPCQTPEFKAALHQMKPLLLQQATATGHAFAMLGVALDWSIREGLAFLEPLREFDEVAVGANWTNLAAVRYIWGDTTATPGLPQIVIVERQLDPGRSGIAVGPEHLVTRLVGAGAIQSWVAQGAPLPPSNLRMQQPGP
jgi:hypothetical protein